jgi:hypothetical protein
MIAIILDITLTGIAAILLWAWHTERNTNDHLRAVINQRTTPELEPMDVTKSVAWGDGWPLPQHRGTRKADYRHVVARVADTDRLNQQLLDDLDYSRDQAAADADALIERLAELQAEVNLRPEPDQIIRALWHHGGTRSTDALRDELAVPYDDFARRVAHLVLRTRQVALAHEHGATMLRLLPAADRATDLVDNGTVPEYDTVGGDTIELDGRTITIGNVLDPTTL